MTEENGKSIIIKMMMIMIIATRCENTGKTKVKKAEASGAPEVQILGKAASWRILTVYYFQLSLVFFLCLFVCFMSYTHFNQAHKVRVMNKVKHPDINKHFTPFLYIHSLVSASLLDSDTISGTRSSSAAAVAFASPRWTPRRRRLRTALPPASVPSCPCAVEASTG